MAHARVPGPVGLQRPHGWEGAPALLHVAGLAPRSTKGGVVPGPIGRQMWQKDPAAAPIGTTPAKPKALIIISTGHDAIKQGVRLKSDTSFDQAARASFAAYTPSHAVTLHHVDSAPGRQALIERGPWDVVIYCGHGVENQRALAPQEGGRPLKKEDLAQALRKAQVKKVYLFGCKAGQTGLARQLSKEVPGTIVYGTFGSLDVDWEQRQAPDGTFTNTCRFKEPLTEYPGGLQTQDGQQTTPRRPKRGDPIPPCADPFAAPLVDQEGRGRHWRGQYAEDRAHLSVTDCPAAQLRSPKAMAPWVWAARPMPLTGTSD